MEDTGADLQGASGQEGSTGTGKGGGTVDYAGFQTPEELAAAYTSANSQLESFQKQVTDLERIKGQNSGQISQLNEKIAQLTGHIEGMRTAQPQQQGPTLDDIAKQLQNGDIDDATAIRKASQITQQQVSTQLGQQFKAELQKELGALKQQTAQERYVQQFMTDNPGYKEAFETGKLQKWIDQGLSGEEAWDKHQLESTRAELAALKKAAEEKAQAAEQAGIDKGLQLSKSGSAAAKVLNGKGGQMNQTTGNYDLSSQKGRLEAGTALLKQLRSGGGG